MLLVIAVVDASAEFVLLGDLSACNYTSNPHHDLFPRGSLMTDVVVFRRQPVGLPLPAPSIGRSRCSRVSAHKRHPHNLIFGDSSERLLVLAALVVAGMPGEKVPVTYLRKVAGKYMVAVQEVTLGATGRSTVTLK